LQFKNAKKSPCLGALVAKKNLCALEPWWQKIKKISVPWSLSGKKKSLCLGALVAKATSLLA
jgi:hypothetical protein